MYSVVCLCTSTLSHDGSGACAQGSLEQHMSSRRENRHVTDTKWTVSARRSHTHTHTHTTTERAPRCHHLTQFHMGTSRMPCSRIQQYMAPPAGRHHMCTTHLASPCDCAWRCVCAHCLHTPAFIRIFPHVSRVYAAHVHSYLCFGCALCMCACIDAHVCVSV